MSAADLLPFVAPVFNLGLAALWCGLIALVIRDRRRLANARPLPSAQFCPECGQPITYRLLVFRRDLTWSTYRRRLGGLPMAINERACAQWPKYGHFLGVRPSDAVRLRGYYEPAAGASLALPGVSAWTPCPDCSYPVRGHYSSCPALSVPEPFIPPPFIPPPPEPDSAWGRALARHGGPR